MNKKMICMLVCLSITLLVPLVSSEYGNSGGSSTESYAGVVTCEASNNIINVESHTFGIRKDVQSIYSFPGSNIIMYQIYVTGKENEENVALRVEYLKGMSVCVDKPAPGTIYRYANIWIGSQNAKNVTVKFRVEDSFVGNNRNFVIFQWDKKNKEWTKLRTTISDKNDKYIYFEFNIENFGPFAIGSPIDAKGTGMITPNVTIETTRGYPTFNIENETPQAMVTQRKGSPDFGVILMIVTLFCAYMIRRR